MICDSAAEFFKLVDTPNHYDSAKLLASTEGSRGGALFAAGQEMDAATRKLMDGLAIENIE